MEAHRRRASGVRGRARQTQGAVCLSRRFCRSDAATPQTAGDKKNKDSAEGRPIRAAGELRVSASPSWAAASVELTLFCILTPDAHSNDRAEWAKIIKTWEGLCKLPHRMV